MFENKVYDHDSGGNVIEHPPSWWVTLKRENYGNYSVIWSLKLGSAFLHLLWIIGASGTALWISTTGAAHWVSILLGITAFTPLVASLAAEVRNRHRNNRKRQSK